MTVKLNKAALTYARQLINHGKYVADDRDAWSEDQPTAEQENAFIAKHGYVEYGKWYLGIETDAAENTKERYKFPYGDFKKVHRCGVVSAEARAGQYKHLDIEKAAAQLHEMIDKVMKKENVHE